MTLESATEARVCDRLRAFGCEPVKMGFDGWPDQIIFVGKGRHIWLEFKKAKTGKLRKSQEARIDHLRTRGDTVLVLDRVPDDDELRSWIATARKSV